MRGSGLNLEVHDKKVKKILDGPKEVQKKIGFEMTKILKKRINQLESFSNFKEYLNSSLGRPHLLFGELSRCYGIHLNKNCRLIVEPIIESFDADSLIKCKNINIK